MAARSVAVTNVRHFPAARSVHMITWRMSKAVNYVNAKVCSLKWLNVMVKKLDNAVN